MSDTYRICSWDVGIKNLAYCILNKIDDEIKIEHWDIINLLEDNYKYCQSQLKRKNKICGKRANVYGTLNDKRVYYCGTHKKRYQPLKDNWEQDLMKPYDEKKNIRRCEIMLPKKGEICNKKASFIKDNVCYCRQHRNRQINCIKRDKALKKIKNKTCSSELTLNLATSMLNKLDKIPELLQVDEVLIENQPTLKNPKMKTVSTFLYFYFVARGLEDKIDNSTINNVRFFSPSNKLRVNEDQTMEVLRKTKNSTETYKMTKKLGIKYTKILLKDDEEMLRKLDSYKKKDDLCDAYLQGYYYLLKK